MTEYEVFIETMTACGGAEYAKQEFMDIECASPEQWVRDNGRWPIVSMENLPGGVTVILTRDCAGNAIRYSFSE